MVTNIQKVSKLAYNVFTRLYENSKVQLSKQNVEQISSLMNNIRRQDANFDISKMSTTSDAPVSYIDIFEDPVMTMAIFIIRDGCRIPLHDHPGMYGFCKVIHGTARVKCYSNLQNFESSPPEEVLKNVKKYLVRPSIKSVVLESDSPVSSEDACCVITPEYGTYHEIVANNGPVAFLDILAPSYDHHTGSRICQYYEEIQGQSDIKHQGKLVKWLSPINQPEEFYCDAEIYEGPPVVEIIQDS